MAKKKEESPTFVRLWCSNRSMDVVQKIWAMGTNESIKPEVRLRALELILAYGIGKPDQASEVSHQLTATIERPAPISREEWIKQYSQRSLN